MNNIEERIEPYVALDEPIPYKDLLIYPIKMKDVFKFLEGYDILTIDKNKIPDVDVIQMNYLQFVVALMVTQKIWLNKFINIMSVCFGLIEQPLIKDFDKNEMLVQHLDNGDQMFFINGWEIKLYQTQQGQIFLYIKDTQINGREFDEVVKTILFQNINGYDDEPMSDDFKQVVEDYYAIKNKNKKPLSIEDKIDTIMSQTSYTKEDIKNMTYRNFERVFEKIVNKVEYVIGQIAIMQGAKIDTEHWVYKSNKNKYSHIFSDADNFSKEITSVH